MKKLLLVLFIITSCVGTPPRPEGTLCCVGQDKHTCGMPGMTDSMDIDISDPYPIEDIPQQDTFNSQRR